MSFLLHRRKAFRGGGGFDFEETFEGSNSDSQSISGYDLTGWTSGPDTASVLPNQTTVVLEGSYSLELKLQAGPPYDQGYIYRSVTSSPNYYIKLRQDLGYLSANTLAPIVAIRDSGGTVLAKIYWQYDGLILASGGTTDSDFATGFVQGDSVYLWLEYEAGSGSNSKARAYVAATDSKPTANCEITTGNETSNAAQVYFGASPAILQYCIFDAIQGSTSAIS